MSEPVPTGGATHRYTLPVTPEDAEVAAATLWTAGASGVWERPDHLIAWFGTRDVPGLPPGGAFSDEPDVDWQAAWKTTIAPVRAGRFCIVPTWLADDHLPGPAEETLVLDPGRAFGSGHHATTAQCLELLDELDEQVGLADRRVADVGCGSGVLTIAAALRGARAVGTDIDPEAVEVTRRNAAANGVEVVAATGSVATALELLGGRAEVVLANLVTDTVAALATELVAALAEGGTLIVSGIAADRRQRATEPLREAGLQLEEERERDGWVALRGRARADRPRDVGADAGAEVGRPVGGPTTGAGGGGDRTGRGPSGL